MRAFSSLSYTRLCIAVCVLGLILSGVRESFLAHREVFKKMTIVESLRTVSTPPQALATYQYAPTDGALVVGVATSTNLNHLDSWRATLGNDGNYWTATRTTSGLDKRLYFDGVRLYGANKILFTIEDANITTADAYVHQICDWVSSTGVDDATDGDCTGGGWRTLQPRRTNHTNTTDTTRVYEIYNGYFSTRDITPGTVIDTPLSNFISSSNNGRVAVRTLSTVNSTTFHQTDFAQIEVAIDPFYEPSGFATTTAATTSDFLSDLVGASGYTTLTATDNIKFDVHMAATSTPISFYFSFSNVKTLAGMNTILVVPEVCKNNANLSFSISLWNFDTNTWTVGSSTVSALICSSGDTDFGFSFNNTLVSDFNLDDHISASGEVRVGFTTNGPAALANLQFDRIYIFVGSVNTDSALCEISFGSGTESDCANTRTMAEQLTGTPVTSTWQQTTEVEYPLDQYPLDNDDDTTNGEYAASSNLSFPMIVASSTSITALHYAVKHRSNLATNLTNDVQMKNYAGTPGLGGDVAASGWVDTPGTDTNAATTYGYFDSWRVVEYQESPEDMVDSVNGRMNLRLRTSGSTSAASGITRDWDFAMVSVRYIDEPRRVTVQTQYSPTGGLLAVGAATNTNLAHYDSWRAALGNDTNYWTATRTASGLDKQLYFDDVNLYSANKIIISVEDSNITTGDAYTHQICDWVSSVGVDNAADSYCTGGGWRTLQPRRTNYTNTSDTGRVYEIYNGYFSTRDITPGTIIDTPLSNFASSTNGRVIFRTYSTVNSTVGHQTDYAVLEVAIDPFYEPSGFATTTAATSSNFFSDLVGAVSTNLTASDNFKFGVHMAATSTPISFYFSFSNVKYLPSMNTIFVSSEMCKNNTGLLFSLSLWDFENSQWTTASSTVAAAACGGTDSDFGFSFNDTLLPGFVFADHISPTGEVRVGFTTNGPAALANLQFDRIYIFVGSVNTDSALCETTWGTAVDSDCTKTRSMAEQVTGTTLTSTWTATTAIEYVTNQYPQDNDDDTTNGEYAYSQNLSFPMVVPTSTAVTGVHYAVKHRSNAATLTTDVQMYDYAGTSGLGGEATGPGWFSTPGTDTNAATTYGYFDSWRVVEHTVSPEDMVDTVNNLMNLRLRTSVSTNITGDVGRDWDFAMVSVRWIEKEPKNYLTFSISDNTVGFGSLSLSNARYATGDGTGTTSSTTAAHTVSVVTNAPGGYIMSIDGSTLSQGGYTIAPIGDTATTSLPGTEQFGLRLSVLTGSALSTAPYNSLAFAFATSSFPDQVASGGGDENVTVFEAYYIANRDTDTDPGAYSSVITYTVTGTF